MSKDGHDRMAVTTHGRFDDAAKVGFAGFEDGFEVGECPLCLWDDAALDDLHGQGVEWDAARDKDEVADFDRLGVGPDGGRGV